MACFMRAYVLRERSCFVGENACGRSCVGVVDVFMMAYLAICTVLLKDISYWITCFTLGYVYRRACLRVQVVFTGVHVLQKGIFYWMICLTGGHLLYENRFYWRVCLTGSHVLHLGMSYMWTYPDGVHVV